MPFDPSDLDTLLLLRALGFALAALFLPTVLLQRKDRPMAALAWILCLLTLPLLGVVLWWIFGLTHMRRKRRKRAHAMAQVTESLSATLADLEGEPSQDDGLDVVTVAGEDGTPPLFEQAEGVFPATRRNRVAVYLNGDEAFDAFEEAILAAEHHIHFEFYIWENDDTGRRFRDLLAQRAREGVEVRVIYDAVGGWNVRGGFLRSIVEAGGQVAPFLPVNLFERRLRINFRNHRKIIVIDGKVGFTGGLNIADEYRDWLDMAFRFDGPVVYQLQEVFAEDWFFTANEDLGAAAYFPDVEEVLERCVEGDDACVRVITSGPDSRQRSIQKAFFLGITMARQRVWLTTPYFVPGEALITALEVAAIRGVDVRLIVPGEGASDVPITRVAGRSFYERLIEAGVRVFEYRSRVLHAKSMIVDHEAVFVGSANLDMRSFRLNFEANCLVADRRVNDALAEVFQAMLEDCDEVALEAVRARPRWQKLMEGGARLFSPLL